MIRNFLALCVTAVLWAGLIAGQASAAVVNMGDVAGPYDLGNFNNLYFFDETYGSGSGADSLEFEFTFSPAPTSADYLVTLNRSFDFLGFEAVWSTDTTIGNADDIALTLGTQTVQFLASSPVYLLLSWTGTASLPTTLGNLDISVQAVPIPASILMLLSGLLGLGFLGRYSRRRASQAL